ncbi:MAG: site-2 protease family protein [Chloroflexi bacterium]|jgi:regulator of sigma E protease|nr:site-2 protease family protein [Chloroflexota bacterium]MBT7082210.1 site-2 protease family protein [Chloroflexota bacterium]MBT7290600.1 site-2 protease family protein [Chloroflexota bacterium]
MTVIITLLIFVVILGVIVFVHELGHLLMAKWRGVKVDEFGIGFPPRLFSFKMGETRYSLNLIPLGGFCKMAGEQDVEEERGLQSKGYGSRLLVFAAGSIMNLLLPFLLAIIAVSVPHPVDVEGVKIFSVLDDSAAATAGLQADDILITANGQELIVTDDFSRILNATPDAPLVLEIERDDAPQTITINPPYAVEDEVSKAGVSITVTNYVMGSVSGWQAIPTGFSEAGRMYAGFGQWIKGLVTGQEKIELHGPIGIAQGTGEIRQYGTYYVLMWAAMISMSIGIMNLLPMPVFDGGHILFVLIEMARRGKRVSLKNRMKAQMVGLVLILTLFFVVGYQDILRLISGESMLL